MARLFYGTGWWVCLLTLVISCVLPDTAAAQQNSSVEDPDIEASSAIVVDADTGEVLFDRDAHLRLPPASLTKIFTALIALESAPLNQQMSVVAEDLVGEASMGLAAGETLSLETLLYGLLLPSGNDAATTIARNLSGGSLDTFMTRANARITELGLTDTALINPHGLDAQLHYSSARDLAAITLFAMKTQPDFTRISGALEHTAESHTLYQTNDLHVTYSGLVAGKTGVTDDAGFCLMEVAERDGRRVITVLLGSTPEAWYGDAQVLLDYGFATLAIPGRLPATDLISIGSPAPDVVSAPSQPSAQQVTSASANLQVIPVGQGTTLVNEPGIAGAAKRSPWLWLTFPLIVVAGVLYALSHIGQLHTRRTSRTLQAVGQRQENMQHGGAAVWETAPFHAVATTGMSSRSSSSYTDDEPDLHLIWDRATRERLLRGRAAMSPSIGD